ncbi:MAG: hypothetical protein ACPK85_07710 [Methanosarcina sp.]
MKSKNKARDYFLFWISLIVTAGSYFLSGLYGWNTPVIILLVFGLLILGFSIKNIVEAAILEEYGNKKQYQIEMKDERNTLIREKAGAKTNEYMLYLCTAILFVLIYLGVEFWVILLIGLLTTVHGILSIALYNYYANKY